MKDEQINLKISPEEKSLLRKAAKNLNFETGAKENVSATIRHAVKKYAETDLTKDELFFCDRDAIKSIDSNVNLGLINLQKFLDEFKLLTGQGLTRDELEHCFEGLGKLGSRQIVQTAIDELVKAKLYEQKRLKYPDLKVTYDLLPDTDLSNLFNIAENLDLLPTVKMQHVGIYWHCYSITGNVISIIPEPVEAIKAGFRWYACTSSEHEKLAKVRALVECLNGFLSDPEVSPDRLFSVVFFDVVARKFAVSGAYVKYPLQQQLFFTH